MKSHLSDKRLCEYLADRIGSSTAVAFFETFSERMVGLSISVNGGHCAVDAGNRPSWQEWELTQAESQRYIVLYHSSVPRVLQLGLNGSVNPYSDLASAAGQIATYVSTLRG